MWWSICARARGIPYNQYVEAETANPAARNLRTARDAKFSNSNSRMLRVEEPSANAGVASTRSVSFAYPVVDDLGHTKHASIAISLLDCCWLSLASLVVVGLLVGCRFRVKLTIRPD